MLSNEAFVRQSLDLDLFFLRIMKEHSIFLVATFTPRDASFASRADAFKVKFEGLLREAVSLANGLISPEAASSGEIVTQYTLSAEKATEFYTGIKIDTGITQAELALTKAVGCSGFQALVQRVADLNQRAIAATTDLVGFKTEILNNVLACRMFIHDYPLLIDHIRREALLFINMLNRLQKRIMFDIVQEAVEQEAFWNRIMAEHAKFIRGFLDPTEVALFETADKFGKEFDALTAQALSAQQQAALLPAVTEKSFRATAEIRNFKRQGTEGILACKIRSIIVPLLGDHVLREANHYLLLLATFRKSVGIS